MKKSLKRIEKQEQLKSEACRLRKEIEDSKNAITKIRAIVKAVSRIHDEKIASDNL